MVGITTPSLRILWWVTIANYLAQIPYYLYNYYFPYHVAPTLSAMVLLGLTLVWFLTGYYGVQRQKTYGTTATKLFAGGGALLSAFIRVWCILVSAAKP